MEGRSGGSFQFDGSWAPLTPYKTIHSSTQPIHAEMMQQSQQNQVDWLGIERSAPGFAEMNGEMSTSEVVGLGAASAGKGRIVFPSDTLGMCIDSSLGAVNHWSMPFADLLALADAASTADRNPGHSRVSFQNDHISTADRNAGHSRVSFPNDHIGSQAASSSAGMLLSANNFALGSSLQLNGNYTAENNGLPYPRHHLYDLNFPPAGMGSADCGMNIHKFAPLTPEKVGMEEIDQVSEIQNLLLCEEENLVRNENEGAAETVDLNMLQGPSQPVTDSSVLVISSPSKDSHNSEGGIQKIDLNKTPQQKPRRRKHRPKVVREDKPKATPKSVTPKTASSKDNPTGKRKYVRKKGVDKPTTPLAEASDDPADPDALKPAKNSCRRALKFSMQEKWECESSTQRTASDLDLDSRAQDFFTGGVQSKSSVQGSQGIELVVESTQAGISCDLTCTENIVINESSSLPEGQVSSTTFQNKTNMVQEILDVRENDQVTVLDTQIDTAKTMLKNTRSPPRSPNDSTSGTSAVLITEEVQTRRSKRKYSRVTKQASNTNTNGAHYNNLQAYSQWLHFPNIFKKKRSEKGQNSVTSTTSSCLNAMHPPTPCCRNDAKAYPLTPKASYWNPNPHLATTRVPAMLAESEREVIEAKRQTIDYLLASTQQERLTKKRSKVPTRVRDLASLNRFAECHMQITSSAKQGPVGGYTQRVTNSQQPHSCIEALVADMQPTMAKKKRSKKIYSVTSTNEMQLQQQMVLYKHHHSFARSSGARAEVILKDLIDAVTEQFKYLDINREGGRITYQQRNALVPYNQDWRALVLYKSDGTVVPFQGPFSPIKKRRPRPKVELDEETSKVWRLLLENINNEGIDGTDEEKRRWWEEERRVFRGRADSFIARMHLVQGDRRFSRWKGSVVDSVIGVFLTQNVSDHLSSSAFMSLAARYPLKSESSGTPLHEEEATLLVKEAEVCILDSEQTTEWKNKMSNLRVCDQSSMTFHDNEHNEEKEVVDSNLSPGISMFDGSVIEKIHSSSLNSFESDVETYRSSTTETTRTETVCFAEDKRAPNDVISSQNSVNSSQNFVESSIAQTAERIGSCSETNSEAEELKNRLQPNSLNCSTSFMELLKMAGSTMLHEVSSLRNSTSEQSILTVESGSLGTLQEKAAVAVQESSSYSENNQSSNIQGEENIQSQNLFGDTNAESLARGQNNKVQQSLSLPNLSGALDVTESSISEFDNQTNNKQKAAENKALKEINAAKQKSRRVGREIKNGFDWDTLRREAEVNGKRERTSSTLDSLDWDAVRCADVNEIADTIKERGMNNMLAERIKAFLNRLVKDHGSIDLEWLRDISPDQAKEYLLSIRGLGLKSVECVRLLTLHHLAFPVDTNVGRIAVRLGWVPLQPLPESLQLHLLELYPVLESIQKYLWPRLCKLEQKQLYELHYQMITFGKVFCTKSKPNCNACPMRGECRHFASAFASARLALPAPEEKSIVTTTKETANPDTDVHINGLPLPPPQPTLQLEANLQLEASLRIEKKCVVGSCEPIIEEPASPEPESTRDSEHDIEDTFYDDPDEIPTIKLNIEEFTQNLQNYMEKNMELQESEMSKALVALNQEAASIPMPKLKNVSRLRTEHQVYELPDSHPLLEGMDKRETDDPCSYLLAIWTPGETADSIQPPEAICTNQEFGKLCDQKTCFACNSTREANSQMVRGTLLIPCRTAMRGSFPLNGTYFQVNEVFADHDSSLNPIDVPRAWLWNLPRRTVYFGTSVPSIFKGLPTEGIQHCFWRGYVCVRGFDQKTKAPRPLMARLHFPASKLTRAKGKAVDE